MKKVFGLVAWILFVLGVLHFGDALCGHSFGVGKTLSSESKDIRVMLAGSNVEEVMAMDGPPQWARRKNVDLGVEMGYAQQQVREQGWLIVARNWITNRLVLVRLKPEPNVTLKQGVGYAGFDEEMNAGK